MKNKLFAILLAVVLVVTCVCLTACEDKPISGSATVVVGETIYTVDYAKYNLTTKHSAFDLLNCIALDTKNSPTPFSFGATFSATGAYLTSATGLVLATSNDYVATYVNDVDYQDTSAYCQPNITHNGVTYYYSGVGVSSIKLTDGLCLMFVVLTFGA